MKDKFEKLNSLIADEREISIKIRTEFKRIVRVGDRVGFRSPNGKPAIGYVLQVSPFFKKLRVVNDYTKKEYWIEMFALDSVKP